ncbi:hypothetical protein Poli38472_013381 [Pythium oligandrum]|uniref:Uncharacterized protein n=1 Tax=Pythium oligandrum TaxID=41045 RepID=A0A8K1C7E1_PYTOL|nr:hypothetical protein Poli38472_013381 [Pythium oligandrum]|eukprot:TMW57907.1 hypothetical protein Poli38472_013381 [Pythium oligandrum]
MTPPLMRSSASPDSSWPTLDPADTLLVPEVTAEYQQRQRGDTPPRHQNVLQSLREQVQTLETQYRALIVQKRRQGAYAQRADASIRYQDPVHTYAALTEMQEELQLRNEAMRVPPASPPDANLPALRPVTAPLSKEEKVERQRIHVRRAYYRKLNLLQSLRDQVHKLEAQYEELIAQKRLMEMVSGPPDAFLTDQFLAEKYADLTELKEEIRLQNEAMRATLAEYQLFSHMMEKTARRRHESTDYDDDANSGQTPSDDQNSRRPSDDVPTLRSPMTVDVCREIVARSLKEIACFRASPQFVTTGASVFGWRDERIRDGNRVKIMLRKIFYGITAFDFSLRAYNVIGSPRMESLYSPSLRARVVPIQDVRENVAVMFRSFTTMNGLAIVQTVFLVARVQVPTGYALIIRSLPRELLAPYEPPQDSIHRQWDDLFVWHMIEPTGDQNQHISVSIGGELDVLQTLGSDAWLLELLFVILRTESAIIGPVFRLQNTPFTVN